MANQNNGENSFVKRNSSIVVVPISETRLIISRNGKNLSLEGDDIQKIVIPILLLLGDGKERTIKEIIEGMNEVSTVQDEKVYEILQQLINLEILHKNSNADLPPRIKLLKMFKCDEGNVEKINADLDRKKVLIVCNNRVSPKISNFFTDFGLNYKIVDENSMLDDLKNISFDFLYYHSSSENVVVTDAINSLCLKYKIPYLLSRSSGFTVEIGPLVIPFKTSCIACRESRKLSAMNFPIEQEFVNNYMRMNNIILDDVDNFFTDIAINYSVMEIFKYLTKDYLWKYPETIENIIRMDFLDADYEYCKVLKNPFCKSCSTNEYQRTIERKTWTTKHNSQK